MLGIVRGYRESEKVKLQMNGGFAMSRQQTQLVWNRREASPPAAPLRERSALGRSAHRQQVLLQPLKQARTVRSRWGFRATRSAVSPTGGQPDLGESPGRDQGPGHSLLGVVSGPRADDHRPESICRRSNGSSRRPA